MNHRANHRRRRTALSTRLLIAVTIGTAVPLFAGASALGQAAPVTPATTAPTVKPLPPAPVGLSAVNTLLPAQATALNNYVIACVTAATNTTDPKAADLARKALDFQAASVGATPAFQAALAADVNSAILGAMKTNDVRVRTAAAVVLARVAAKLPHAGLTPAVTAALGDKSEAVVVPALRAAKAIYPGLLAANPKAADAIANLVIAAVRRFVTSAAVAEEAFDVIAGTAVTATSPVPANAVDRMIDLLQARADLFAKANAALLPEDDPNFPAMPSPRPNVNPNEPKMEGGAANFLAFNWATLGAAQQPRAGRALFDLSSELGRLATGIPPAGPGEVGLVRQQDLVNQLDKTIAAIQVAGGRTPNGATVATEAKAIQKMLPGGGGGIMSPLLPGAMTTLQAAMTTAGILGPKPAPAAVAPAPVAPAPAPRPAKPAPKPAGAPIAPAKPAGAPAGPVPTVAPAAPAGGNGVKPGGAASGSGAALNK